MRITGLVFSIVLLIMSACDEQPSARISPHATIAQTIGDSTKIDIHYNRPGVKGRPIWGDLVSYGKVWRTGANEATVFEVNHPVSIDGSEVAAGKYALFTIPGEDSWTIILNSEAEQWGAYDYDESKDALRVEAIPMESSHTEWLTFSFDSLSTTHTRLVMRWGTVAVGFDISTTVNPNEPRLSPAARVKQTIGIDTEISVRYSRPGQKGRKLWGELVPLDTIWRTGANENTTITFSKDVSIAGKPLAAGIYGLHTIPGTEEWTIIFSKNYTAWGSFYYNQEEDALRVTARPRTSSSNAEWLQFSMPEIELANDDSPRGTTVTIEWGQLQVPIAISLPAEGE